MCAPKVHTLSPRPRTLGLSELLSHRCPPQSRLQHQDTHSAGPRGGQRGGTELGHTGWQAQTRVHRAPHGTMELEVERKKVG